MRAVEKGRPVASREVAGSLVRTADGQIIRQEALWGQWRRCKYREHLGVRNAGSGESNIDETLHSIIAKRILTPQLQNSGQTMVLLTGDGNDYHEGRSTFPGLATGALNLGWNVEVWSWRASLSKNFLRLAQKFPGRLTVVYLDDIRDTVTIEF